MDQNRRKYDKSSEYYTRKVTLPGGEVIEIVYFPTASGKSPVSMGGVQSSGNTVPLHEEYESLELHICPRCESDLVYPLTWAELKDDKWRIERRCPNCEWRHVGEFTQDEVEPFDDVLNDGTEDLLINLRSFARANMESDVEWLADAIRTGLIEPMDF